MERAKYVSGKNYFNENSFNNIVKELENINTNPNIYHLVVGKDVNLLKKKSEVLGKVTSEVVDNKMRVYLDNELYQEVDLVVNNNENAKETLLREVKEEVGLEVSDYIYNDNVYFERSWNLFILDDAALPSLDQQLHVHAAVEPEELK